MGVSMSCVCGEEVAGEEPMMTLARAPPPSPGPVSTSPVFEFEALLGAYLAVVKAKAGQGCAQPAVAAQFHRAGDPPAATLAQLRFVVRTSVARQFEASWEAVDSAGDKRLSEARVRDVFEAYYVAAREWFPPVLRRAVAECAQAQVGTSGSEDTHTAAFRRHVGRVVEAVVTSLEPPLKDAMSKAAPSTADDYADLMAGMKRDATRRIALEEAFKVLQYQGPVHALLPPGAVYFVNTNMEK